MLASETILKSTSKRRNAASGMIRYHAFWKVKMLVASRKPNIVATAFPPLKPAKIG